ncbi:hypothetical protein FB451DRAFT_1186154 [Mycena latifolia]|nr:hypothetical protein FB451DRAFT_1186154 [Mycena latifolia]
MSPPPSPTKKPPHKKRHTKPCRYFQTGSCPHAAQEDCDFAHVYSDQTALPPPKQCRYYLQGICTNGIWCQYRHGEGSTEDASLLDDVRNGNSLAGGREFGTGPNAVQMRVGIPPSVYIPSTFNGMYVSPTPAPWSPYAEGFHSPFEFGPPPPHFVVPNPVVSPAASLDSIDSATPSSSPTSSVSDDGVPLCADDAPGNHYAYFNCEPQATYLSSPYADDAALSQFARVPLNMMPAPYGMAPLYDIFSPKAPPSADFYSTASFPPRPEALRAPANRLKLASYRTKPCRYFKPGSVCPNGDACTFIHGDPESSETPSPTQSPVKLQHELPSKPLSVKEDNTRKGYFPISWRVIGGGVLVGGTKGDNNSLSDDVDSDLSDDDSFDGREDPVARVLEIDIPLSAPATAVDFPVEESERMTPTGLPTRPRASSIPSTPIATHVDVLRLFSAESPGGL